MEPALLPGDGILVSKIHYGPRIDLNSFFSSNNEKIGLRLPGVSEVKRGDIIVFNSPLDYSTNIVKRCVALPGDTLEIKNSRLFINNLPVRNISTLFSFKVISSDTASIDKFLSVFKISVDSSRFSQKKNIYYLSMSNLNAEKLSQIKGIDTILKITAPIIENGELFLKSPQINWTKENYGPLVIPKKGTQIILNNESLPMYAAILKFEQKSIRFKQNAVYLNNKVITSYTLRNNYYFVMGDNRDHSYDSRWIGFIPYNLIIGKAVYILFSEGRLFKKIE